MLVVVVRGSPRPLEIKGNTHVKDVHAAVLCWGRLQSWGLPSFALVARARWGENCWRARGGIWRRFSPGRLPSFVNWMAYIPLDYGYDHMVDFRLQKQESSPSLSSSILSIYYVTIISGWLYCFYFLVKHTRFYCQNHFRLFHSRTDHT